MLNRISVKIVLFVFLSIYGFFALWSSIEGINKFGFDVHNIISCIGGLVMMISLPIFIKFPRSTTLLLWLIAGLAVLDLILRKY